MIREPGHDERLALLILGLGAFGERDAEDLGCFLCILLVGLVEVTCTEQKERVGVLLLQVEELSEHRRECNGGHGLGLSLGGFLLGFLFLLLLFLLLRGVTTFLFLLFLLRLRLLFLLFLLLVFLFMGFDILCRLLGLRLSLLLGLVCAYGNGIVLFLTEDIGKE